jgi:hypothetical protein
MRSFQARCAHAVATACGSSPHSFSQSVSMLCLPHQKILEDQIPLAARQWSAATTALYLAINCIGSGFDFDDAIKCVAGRAMERGWLVRNHDMPPTLVLLLLGLTYIPIDTMANSVMRLSLGTVTLGRPRSHHSLLGRSRCSLSARCMKYGVKTRNSLSTRLFLA